jgi:hypothetical protein
LKYGINLYVNEYCIDSYLDNIISFIPQMKWFSLSMIADFISRIYQEINTKKILLEWDTLTLEEIHNIFISLHTTKHDFEEQRKSMDIWLDSVMNWSDNKLWMGYMSNVW